MKKRSAILSFFLILIFVLSPVAASAYDITGSGFTITSEVALLVSLDTGETIYSTDKDSDTVKSTDQKYQPAALTNLMTAVVVLENCEDIDTQVTVTSDEIDPLLGTGAAVAGLKEDEKITVRSLLHLILMGSAADASNVLAGFIGGDIDSFVAMMNEKAADLSMDSTHFVNAHGLSEDNQYTTANDLYKLAKYALDLPMIMEICEKTRYDLPQTNQNSARVVSTTNMLIDPTTSYYYTYAKGMKTGYSSESGRCLISTASKDGYNYMCIILGGDNATRSEFTDSENLYRWVFDEYEYRKVADTATQIGEMEVELAWDTDYIQLFPEQDVSAIVPKNIDNSSIRYELVTDQSVWAPVEKGEIMGKAVIYCAENQIGEVNVVAGETIKRNQLLFIAKIFNIIVTSKIFIGFVVVLVLLLIGLIVTNIFHQKRKRGRNKKVKPIRKL